MKRQPINRQVIVIYQDGVHRGLFGKGEYVSTIDVREPCMRPNCSYASEHYTFDGQFFYRRKYVQKTN